MIVRSSEISIASGETIDRLRGAEFQNLDASHPQFGRVEGVLVARVDQGSPAARNGLRQGNIILAVNRSPVASVQELSSGLRDADAIIAPNILRGNARLFIVIQ